MNRAGIGRESTLPVVRQPWDPNSRCRVLLQHAVSAIIDHREDQVLFVNFGPAEGRGDRVISALLPSGPGVSFLLVPDWRIRANIGSEVSMSSAKIAIPTEKIAALCLRNHIRSLALFGSVLRDDFRPDSDVDVLIDFESDAGIGFLALGRIRRELAALLDRPVDLVLRDGLKPRLRDSVLAGAEIVYAA